MQKKCQPSSDRLEPQATCCLGTYHAYQSLCQICHTFPIAITRKIIFIKCTATYGKVIYKTLLSPITLDHVEVLQQNGWNFTQQHPLFHIIAKYSFSSSVNRLLLCHKEILVITCAIAFCIMKIAF